MCFSARRSSGELIRQLYNSPVPKLICGLSHKIPADPVVVKGCYHLFDRSVLEVYIEKQQRCPSCSRIYAFFVKKCVIVITLPGLKAKIEKYKSDAEIKDDAEIEGRFTRLLPRVYEKLAMISMSSLSAMMTVSTTCVVPLYINELLTLVVKIPSRAERSTSSLAGSVFLINSLGIATLLIALRKLIKSNQEERVSKIALFVYSISLFAFERWTLNHITFENNHASFRQAIWLSVPVGIMNSWHSQYLEDNLSSLFLE